MSPLVENHYSCCGCKNLGETCKIKQSLCRSVTQLCEYHYIRIDLHSPIPRLSGNGDTDLQCWSWVGCTAEWEQAPHR